MTLQTTAVARQWLSTDHAGTPTYTKQWHRNRGTVFSVLSVQICYKQEKLVDWVSKGQPQFNQPIDRSTDRMSQPVKRSRVSWLNNCSMHACMSVTFLGVSPSQYLSLYVFTGLLLELGRFSISQSYTQLVGLLGRGISPSQGRYLHTEQHKQNKRTQIPMPWVRFEPTIPEFERGKTVYALDRAVTVIDYRHSMLPSIITCWHMHGCCQCL
jgi:hypothetical protein